MNKKEIAIILSKLKQFVKPEAKLEQYTTDSEIAAQITWIAYLNYDIDRKIVADFGCGNGILGIASLLLGAKKVYFIDVSPAAISLAKENLAALEDEFNFKFDATFLNMQIEDVDLKVDTVIQNPPFGVKVKHADKPFLEKAMSIAEVIYSIHKAESDSFIYKLASSYDFKVDSIIAINLPLKNTMKFHDKKVHKVKTAVYRLKRNI